MNSNRLPRLLLIGVLAAFTLGCKNTTLPPQASPEAARVALTTALDAWKNGGNTKEKLAGGEHPIYFNDPKWSPDVQLLDFKLSESHTTYGQSVRFAVVLSIRTKSGAVEEKKASYMVDTAPAIVIVPG